MSISKQILRIGLSAALGFLTSGIVCAQNGAGEVVASVGGVKVTLGELEQEEAGKLLNAHYKYYEAETRALNELIDKKVLEQKAKSENLTVDQLVDRDINSQVKDPTEDQMRVYYEGLDMDQPYEAVQGKILEKIRQVRTQKARAAYVKALRAQSTVSIALLPPSMRVDTRSAQTMGPADAPVTLVEFADYECPYCQKSAPDVQKLKAEYGDKIVVAFRDFPLAMHPRAEKAAEAARCASKQGKFWEYHDELFHSKELDLDQLKAQAEALKLDSAEFDKCLDSGEQAAAVEKDRKEGLKLGLNGTPAFFVNGYFLSGAADYSTLHQLIEQQLASPKQIAANSAGSK
jgi:protein-disulfide isomerase